tara:strand:- start:627 stop:968 length:342 start_codon:yes stop_codon:yes gene_type:complete
MMIPLTVKSEFTQPDGDGRHHLLATWYWSNLLGDTTRKGQKMNSPGHGNFKVVTVDSDGQDWPVGYGHETLAEAVKMAELQAHSSRNFPNDYVQIWDCTSGLMVLVWSSKVSV